MNAGEMFVLGIMISVLAIACAAQWIVDNITVVVKVRERDDQEDNEHE